MKGRSLRNNPLNNNIFDQKVILSRNLILKSDKDCKKILINRLASTALNSSPSLLEFLNQFRKKPVLLSTLLAEYSDTDLLHTISHLLKINFLIHEKINEEFDWLKKRIDMSHIKEFETTHFIILYSGKNGYQARNFSAFMERVFNVLIQKLNFSSTQKILIYICKDRNEFQKFWGNTSVPDWANAFVYSSNLMIVSQQRVNKTNLKGEGPFQGMVHELAHIFLGQMACQLPVWLEEGLCEYFSKTDYGRVSFENCRQKLLYGFKEIELFANPSLLELDNSPVGENICYRQSYSFAAYLMNLKGRHCFTNLLASMKLGDTFNTNFKEYYGFSIDDAQKKWQKQYPQIKTLQLKTSKNLRIIKGSKNVLLYNAFYGNSLKADKEILILLECFENKTTLSEISAKFDIENLDPIVTRLFNKRLIVFDHEQEVNIFSQNYNHKQVQKGFLINKLRLNMSNSCNMACHYCYIDPAKTEHMSWQTAKKALTLFFDLQKQSGQKESQIRFFVGEPLLNWHVMEHVFEYIQDIKKDIAVEYILNTNGTIMTEQIARTLASNRANLSISIDGLHKIHDTLRSFKSGKGTFSKIDTNLNLLIISGCNIALSTTIGDHNYNKLNDLITYIAEKNCQYNSSISLSLQSMCMESKQRLDTVPINKKMQSIKKAVLYAVKKGVNINFGMLMFPLNALLGLKTKGAYCNAVAGKEICVYSDGDIYPCGTLKIELGNLEKFNTIFQTAEYLNLIKRVTGNIPECKSCDIEAFCAGGCTADALEDNDIFLPTKNCKFEQLFFKSMVKEYLNGMYG